ncbi:hypothetical protein [Paraburkholderia sp. J76]|uniref:hypothetical protein n=1 Tax=Paraburkholderia sp. J76 TaxID=2805439 RepID=UPI002ABD6EF2|nr:hypothetical protein [Paraburkholderia sp. J76]
MVNFVCFLLWNLALLFAVRVGCWLIGCARPDVALNGTRIFVGLMSIALAFDTAVTFLVFADAGGPWQAHNPSETYPERAFAYALAALMALLIARHARRQDSRKARSEPAGEQEIETSPYSKSTLRM